MGYHHSRGWILYVFITLLAFGCASDNSTDVENFSVTIRLPSEPDNLNPTRSRNTHATSIESLIIPPLAEYDPYTLELTPLLIKSLATIVDISEGEYEGGQRFSYEIRDEAVWDDGSPVTAYDYEFTLKAVMNPEVDAAQWRAYLSFIKAVEIDAQNPRKFDVIVEEPYMLAEAITCNFNILPKYVYDSKGIMDDIRLSDLADNERLAQVDEGMLSAFAQQFASVGFNRDTIIGAGAYRLVEWTTGQQIVLQRKEDWWGDKLDNPPVLLKAYPAMIKYQIIPDEAMAIAALKDGSVDVAPSVSATAFDQMRKNPQWQEGFTFLTPEVLRYRYIEVNNRHEILREKNVRKALAYVVDYDAILSNVELGVGARTIGPFSPSRDYYNEALPLPTENIDTARILLEEAGWTDSNNDGTVDKVIDGVRQELVVDFLTTQSPAGQKIALIVQEGAAKAGIGIEIVTKDANAWRQALAQRNFELLPMQVTTSPAISDPYQGWHSSSDQPGGSNRSGFRNEDADLLIEKIRLAEDAEERKQYYLDFQEVLVEEQPVIFLYIPYDRIIANSRLNVEKSSRRPGYFVNLFTLRGV